MSLSQSSLRAFMNPTQSLFETRLRPHSLLEGVSRDVVHPPFLVTNEQDKISMARSMNSNSSKPAPGGVLTRSRFIDIEPNLAETLVGLVGIFEMNDRRLNPILGSAQDLEGYVEGRSTPGSLSRVPLGSADSAIGAYVIEEPPPNHRSRPAKLMQYCIFRLRLNMRYCIIVKMPRQNGWYGGSFKQTGGEIDRNGLPPTCRLAPQQEP